MLSQDVTALVNTIENLYFSRVPRRTKHAEVFKLMHACKKQGWHEGLAAIAKTVPSYAWAFALYSLWKTHPEEIDEEICNFPINRTSLFHFFGRENEKGIQFLEVHFPRVLEEIREVPKWFRNWAGLFSCGEEEEGVWHTPLFWRGLVPYLPEDREQLLFKIQYSCGETILHECAKKFAHSGHTTESLERTRDVTRVMLAWLPAHARAVKDDLGRTPCDLYLSIHMRGVKTDPEYVAMLKPRMPKNAHA